MFLYKEERTEAAATAIPQPTHQERSRPSAAPLELKIDHAEREESERRHRWLDRRRKARKNSKQREHPRSIAPQRLQKEDVCGQQNHRGDQVALTQFQDSVSSMYQQEERSRPEPRKPVPGKVRTTMAALAYTVRNKSKHRQASSPPPAMWTTAHSTK